MTTEKATARPTKKLFIDTLVRDVDLISAIVDLVDNCVDGARRIRPNSDFTGLLVALEIGAERFKLQDNCGGIPLETAKEYAFRFGREDDYRGAVKHSVGHFGVGMKRTLFKIADKFTVHSVTTTDQFTLNVDIGKWKEVDDWDFLLENVSTSGRPLRRPVGTSIEIGKIKPEISEEFGVELFRNDVRERIRIAHGWAISQGLDIQFNGVSLDAEELTIKASRQIQPLVERGQYSLNDGSVSFEIIAGIAERGDKKDTALSGWYVFCNGRLLLRADQTSQSGWGIKPAPVFHQQFSWFRGYLFLEADNAGLLPWNTTKTGIAEDSDVYRKLKPKMTQAIYEVTRFLNTVRAEEKEIVAGRAKTSPLLNEIERAEDISVSPSARALRASQTFVYPKRVAKQEKHDRERTVTYKVSDSKLRKVMDALEVSSPSQAGLQTFEYYLDLLENS